MAKALVKSKDRVGKLNAAYNRRKNRQPTNFIQYISVIMLCAYELRRFLIRAYYAGMCNGDYVFIYPSLDIPTDSLWRAGDNLDSIAKEAAKYLLLVRISNSAHKIILLNTLVDTVKPRC